MYKYTALLFFSISLSFLFGPKPTEQSVRIHLASADPVQSPTPEIPVDVESIIFDKEKLWLPCPSPPVPMPEDFASVYASLYKDPTVEVTTVVNNAGKSNLNYFYTLSGGRIVGTGESVIWNLSGLRNGKYSITAGASTGNVVRGKTVT